MIWDILWVVGALAVAFALFALAVYLRVMWPTIMKSGNGAKKIACVGDSITYGFGVLGRRKNWAFPAIIAKRIGDDYTVINYGLSDRTLLSTADRPYFKEKIGKEAWETDAQTVIFMLGTNDCKRSNWNGEQFKKEYAECIRHYVAANKQLYVVIPPQIFYEKETWEHYDISVLKDQLLPTICELSEQAGVPCIDIYSVTKDHPEWFPDKLHPNKDGNVAIAEEILAHIKP